MLRNQLRIIRDLLRYQLIIRNNRVKLFNQTPCVIVMAELFIMTWV